MYDTKVSDVVKIGKQVAYGPELEITPGTSFPEHYMKRRFTTCSSDLLTPAQKPHAVKYKLFGGV